MSACMNFDICTILAILISCMEIVYFQFSCSRIRLYVSLAYSCLWSFTACLVLHCFWFRCLGSQTIWLITSDFESLPAKRTCIHFFASWCMALHATTVWVLLDSAECAYCRASLLNMVAWSKGWPPVHGGTGPGTDWMHVTRVYQSWQASRTALPVPKKEPSGWML